MKLQSSGQAAGKSFNPLMYPPKVSEKKIYRHVALVLGKGFFMESIAAIVTRSGEFEKVIFCHNISEALAWLNDGKANYLFMEDSTGENDILLTIRQVNKLSKKTNVLVFVNYQQHFDINGMVLAGARGFICKNAESKTIADSIRETKHSGFYLCPGSVSYFINDSFTAAWKFRFTFRQLIIFKRMSAGISIHNIAAELAISVSSLYGDTKSMMKKLNVTSVKELADTAVKMKDVI